MGQELVIEVKNLVKRYGEHIAVNQVSFEVEKGEIFGLLGPNGAGKSTTIEALIGLKHDVEGEIRLLGMDVRRDREYIKKKIGVQLQQSSHIKKLKVIELLTLFSSFYDNPEDVNKVLRQVNLEKESRCYMHQLSGGQQQRVGTALSFISNGDIIFLDEPTIGLDAISRRRLWETLKDMQKAGKTIFLTTHYMDEAQLLCNRIAIMNEGKIIALDTPKQLIKSHCKETVLEFERYEMTSEILIYLDTLAPLCRIEACQDRYRLYTHNLAKIMQQLYKEKSPMRYIRNVAIRQPDLEDVFITLTGKELVADENAS